MTKKQTIAACVALAPDFKLTVERPQHDHIAFARFSMNGTPLVLAMVIGPLGRAATETRILEAALARLRKKAA